MPSIKHPPLLSDSDRHWRLQKEDLHIKNEDTDSEHTIQVSITREGSLSHEAQYHLRPGQSGCSVNLLSDGTYTVKAVLDEQQDAVREVTVSDERSQTIFIEVAEAFIEIYEGVTSLSG